MHRKRKPVCTGVGSGGASRRATFLVAQNFIEIADRIARQVEEFSCRDARAAHQAMPGTVRNKGEVPGASRLGSIPSTSGGHSPAVTT